MILALDPSSTAIGYAIFDSGKRVEAGVIRPTAKKADALTRADQMCGDVQAILEEHPDIELALIEEPYVPRKAKRTNVSAQFSAYGMFWRVLKRSQVKRVVEIHPATWTGNTKKETRAALIRERHGIGANDDKGNDACDAIGICEWWLNVGQHRKQSA